jgi:hypothetical protein
MDTEAEEISTTEPEALEVLGKEIEELHDLAERSMRTSLDYARLAGVKLIEAKALVKYGQWQSWVATQCGFSQATANLYMKIAREWNQYGESQRVGIFTLRDAAQLLYMDNDEEHANAVGDLVNLGVIWWSDLDGLDPIERRTLVNEVRSLYEDYCVDDDTHKIPDELKAKRAAMKNGGEYGVQYSQRAIRRLAHTTLVKLKNGQLNRNGVRSDLRTFERATKRNQGNAGTGDGSARVTVNYLTPLESYLGLAKRLRWATRDLFTGPHGLLGLSRPDERPPFSREACSSVLDVIQTMRSGLDTLEKQALERIREFDVADRAAVAALGPAWEPDDDLRQEIVPSEMVTVS